MERKQVSARRLADALGIATQTVYSWQNGKTTVNEDRVPRLAEVLGVSEMEARRGLGYWVPDDGSEVPPELDRDQLREALQRFRQAADDLERLINREP
jgi:transcriptional regulator with XRE-family HTH domain